MNRQGAGRRGGRNASRRPGGKAATPPRAGRPVLSQALAWRLSLSAAVLALVILCVPRLSLGYFWDDYIFLTSSRENPLSFLLPNPTTIFYRPISMGLYFLLLLWLGPLGGVSGHILNLTLLAICVVLVTTLVARVAGRRAGVFAGFVYAALSSAPSLVAWITASQDIFAILFLLIAFHMRHSGRTVGTVLAAGCALLSKETAVALMPALVLWPWILGRGPRRLVLHGILVAALVAVWATMHPAGHAFLARGIGNEAAYVHLQETDRWALHLGRYVVALFNLPIPGYPAVWPRELTPFALGATAIVVAGAWIAGSRVPRERTGGEISLGRIAALAAVLSLPPLILYVTLVGHWAPYYICLPGIGGALLLGVLLSRLRREVSAALLVVFLLLGVRSRGIDSPELVFTERNMVMSSRAVRMLESRFRELRPTMPRGAELLVSVGMSGGLGLYQTIQQGQAPRVWYGDPTLDARPPEQRQGGRPALLFRTTTVLSVAEIEPESLGYRWAGEFEPFQDEIAGPIRAFARGTAASGETDRALRILRNLSSLPPDSMRAYDRRLMALVLLSAERESEAAQILDSTPAFTREETLPMVNKLLEEATRRPHMDSKVFRAFGVSPADSAQIVSKLK